MITSLDKNFKIRENNFIKINQNSYSQHSINQLNYFLREHPQDKKKKDCKTLIRFKYYYHQ